MNDVPFTNMGISSSLSYSHHSSSPPAVLADQARVLLAHPPHLSATPQTNPPWIYPHTTAEAARRLERVLTNDPGTGLMPHVAARYEEAMKRVQEPGLQVPMLESHTPC